MNVSSTHWYMLHGKYCLLNISAFLLWPSQPHLTSQCRETDKPLFCDNIRAKLKRKKMAKREEKNSHHLFLLKFAVAWKHSRNYSEAIIWVEIIPSMFFTPHIWLTGLQICNSSSVVVFNFPDILIIFNSKAF